MPQQQRPQRRWYQFSLRTLLVATALAAGLAFAWAKCVEPYRLQRNAMAVITKLGGTYKAAQNVTVVDLADCDKPDEYMPHLARLPRLKTLVLGGHSVGDEQVAALGRVGSLKGLVLDSTLVTDEAVEELKEKLSDLVICKSERRACRELEKVGAVLIPYTGALVLPRHKAIAPEWLRSEVGNIYFVNAPWKVRCDGIADTDLAWLANTLEVRGVVARKVGNTALAVLAEVPMETLDLSGTAVTDEGLVHLLRNTSLRYLSLNGTKVTDKGVTDLEKCTHLTVLEIVGTDISTAGVQRLRDALPQCTIRHYFVPPQPQRKPQSVQKAAP